MISPSNAAANATGIGSSLTLILILRSSSELLYRVRVIGFGFQRARHLHIAQINVRHHREAQRNRARARGDDHLVQRAERIDKRRNALLGVFEQSGQIARLHAAEDQRRANCDGDDVNDARYIATQRHDAEFKPELYARFNRLINAFADQERKQSLRLVILDDARDRGGIVALSEHQPPRRECRP